MSTSFSASFIGALQGTVSVVLTLFVGYFVARRGYLDRDTVNRLTKLCSLLFLPCLMIVQMGPELTTSHLKKLWIIPLWGLISTIVAHLLGWIGQVLFKMPYWTIVAAGRPNSNALPLLLLQSLEYTGVLDTLGRPGDSVSDTLARAKSIILLNVIVQQIFTFQFAPAVLNRDKTKDDADVEDQDPRTHLTPGTASHHLPIVVQDPEHVGLLSDMHDRSYGTSTEYQEYGSALGAIGDQPDYQWPSSLALVKKPIVAVYRGMSPPLIGAIIAFILGMVPFLHEVFLNPRGALYSSFTQSLKNLGDLFVVLQTVVVGAQLALVPHVNPGLVPTAYCLSVRFLLMPALSLLFVFATAGRSLYVDDKLVWFLLVLIPSGPSAMLLASVAEMVHVDQGPISGYLTISYLFSPVMALICSLAMIVVHNVGK